jgi:GNAT superfamily N-acetyltransferase
VSTGSFIVWDDDTPTATITINRWAKPELWTEEEAAEPALYAHKVTVDRAYGGQGLGAELLDWAGTRAAEEDAVWLRVDVWTTNERLQHYYLEQGFTYVRTVVLPHNPSGALFQRPAERVPTPRATRGREPDRLSLGRAAGGPRGGSLDLPPRPGWRDLAGR